MVNLLFKNIISKYAVPYDPDSNATRCRCILLNKEQDSVAMVKRIREGMDVYYVFPGGGVENEDKDFIDTMYREIKEEVGLEKENIELIKEHVIIGNDIFKNEVKEEHFSYMVFLGIANSSLLKIDESAPENLRNKGIYQPTWVPLKDIKNLNIKHEFLKKVIIDCLE